MMLLANQNSKMVIYIYGVSGFMNYSSQLKSWKTMAECEIITLSVTKEQKEAIEKLFEDNKWELTYQTIEGMCDLFSFQ